jgi:predicted GTPase
LPYDPIFISAEHGDGLPDLFQKIKMHIPEHKEEEFINKKKKRVERYLEYKDLLMDEIV